jgi:hypothetical protein
LLDSAANEGWVAMGGSKDYLGKAFRKGVRLIALAEAALVAGQFAEAERLIALAYSQFDLAAYGDRRE